MEAKLKKIEAYSVEKMSGDLSGHGMDHVRRVVANAEMILTEEPAANKFITLAAAYLHDTIDDKLVEDEKKAFDELHDFLVSLKLSAVEINAILEILQNMSYSKSLDKQNISLSLEGQIVQDADRLDALGAMGILRTAYYGGKKGHPLHDPEILPIDYQNKADYRKGSTVINHFYEKLLLLSEKMNTAIAKKEGQRRTEFMQNFLKEFYAEWK